MINVSPTDQPPGALTRVALGLSYGLSPAGLAVLVLATAVGAGRMTPLGAAVGVGLLAIAPAVVLGAMARRARLDDVFDPPPALRQRMLRAGILCYVAAWGLGTVAGLGPALSWVAATFGAGAAIVWGIDRRWKISIHNTGAGGTAVLLSGFLEPPLRPLCWLLPIVVGWARWQRGAHTPAQLVVGAALGAAVAWGLSRGLP